MRFCCRQNKDNMSGGSSNVFKSALKAPIESMWTSSIMYTLYSTALGAYFTLSLISRISSTPLFEAASISNTSEIDPCVIPKQEGHSLQGSATGACSQLIAFANTFAIVVFLFLLGQKINMHVKLSLEEGHFATFLSRAFDRLHLQILRSPCSV